MSLLSSKRSFWQTAFLIWLGSRLLVLGGFLGSDIATGRTYEDTAHRLGHWASGWDSGFYHFIAAHGYSVNPQDWESGASVFAFFPLLPAAARLISEATGLGLPLAGALGSNLFFLAALCLFARYARDRCGEATALRATALLAFCPHGFVFSIFYTESLFLLLSVGAVVAFDNRRFGWSGASAALLSLTRPNGLFAVFYFGWKTLEENARGLLQGQTLRQRLEPLSWQLLPIVLAPLGLFAFWAYCYYATGDAFAQRSTAEHGWGVSLGAPFKVLFNHFGTNAKSAFWLGGGLFFLLSSLLLLRYRLRADFVFALSNFVLFFANPIPNSMLRYSIVVFPVYVALALATRRFPAVFGGLITAFAAINLFLCHAWIQRCHISI